MKRKLLAMLIMMSLLMLSAAGCQGSGSAESGQAASQGASSASSAESESSAEPSQSSEQNSQPSAEESRREETSAEPSSEPSEDSSEASESPQESGAASSGTNSQSSETAPPSVLAKTMLPDEEWNSLQALIKDSAFSDLTPIAAVGLQVVAGYNKLYLSQRGDGSWYVLTAYIMPDETVTLAGVKPFDTVSVKPVTEETEGLAGGVECFSTEGEVPAENLSCLPSSVRDRMAEQDYHPLAVISAPEGTAGTYQVFAQKSSGTRSQNYLLTFTVREDGSSSLTEKGLISLSSYLP